VTERAWKTFISVIADDHSSCVVAQGTFGVIDGFNDLRAS
jgi:hypothetical protein